MAWASCQRVSVSPICRCLTETNTRSQLWGIGVWVSSPKANVFVNPGCNNMNWTETTEIYFSWFWRLEVQDQGASIVGFCESRRLTFHYILTWWRTERRSKPFYDLYKGTNPIHEGSTLNISSNPNSLLKFPSPTWRGQDFNRWILGWCVLSTIVTHIFE
jgi:hypothetical protein